MKVGVKIALVGEQGPGLPQQAGSHGAQGLGFGFPPFEQALVERRAGRVSPAGRPGSHVEQAPQAPVAELAQAGAAPHATARLVVARAQPGVSYYLAPASKGAQARPHQQQGLGVGCQTFSSSVSYCSSRADSAFVLTGAGQGDRASACW
jgi:hypothetical protein